METYKLEDGTEVVKLADHNSTLANLRKNATKGYVHTGDENYKKDMEELNHFRSVKATNELKTNYLGDAGFKIKPEYQDDVIKLAGLKGGMEEKEVKKILTDFTSAPKNAHYLDIDSNSGSPDHSQIKITKTNKSLSGGGFWTK